MSNTAVQTATPNQVALKNLFAQEGVKAKIEEMLGKRSTQFITSVLQIVNSNDLLKNADPMSVYNAAVVAATLDLPLNNGLGLAYIIPFGNKAQFQIGYKGFKQLAIRSGQFELMNESDVREGEIKFYNRLSGEIQFEWNQNTTERLSKKVVGYVSYFKLINGFEHTHYMTVEELDAHGKRFSQTYKKGFGLWKDDFDSMCRKTVVKLNLSKNAPLSVEMQRAVVVDQSVINNSETLDVDHVDMTNDNGKTPEENAMMKIIDGLEFYQGTDKEIIRQDCIDIKKAGKFTMAYAETVAKKIGVDLD